MDDLKQTIADTLRRVTVESPERRQAREAEEARERSARTISLFDVVKADGVPKRFRQLLPIPEPTTAVKQVEAWARGDGWVLVLSGPKGVGKSFAAARFLWNHAMETGRRPHAQAKRRWYPATLLARLSGYGDELEELNGLATLVIDDLGVEYTDRNGNFRSRMDYLLDARYGEELPTVITTNLDAKGFERRYGDRVLDRVRDGGAFVVVREQSRRGR